MQAIYYAPTDPASILVALEERGITASVEGIGLRFNGPAGSLTPELKAAIKRQGAGLLVAITGFAQLDRAIIQDTARKHTVDQIRTRLDHFRLMAEAPGATPVWAQAGRDWAAILVEKQRGAASGEVSDAQ